MSTDQGLRTGELTLHGRVMPASNATFVGTRVLVANQSPITATAEHLVILDVEVGEVGAARYLPKISTLA